MGQNEQEILYLTRRVIKLENDLAELSRRPIATDYGAPITNMHQEIIGLKNIVQAQQTAIEAHGKLIVALRAGLDTALSQSHTHDNKPIWQNIFTFGN